MFKLCVQWLSGQEVGNAKLSGLDSVISKMQGSILGILKGVCAHPCYTSYDTYLGQDTPWGLVHLVALGMELTSSYSKNFYPLGLNCSFK